MLQRRGAQGQGGNVLPFASPQRELMDAARQAIQRASFQFDLDEQGSSHVTGVVCPWRSSQTWCGRWAVPIATSPDDAPSIT
jgi:hypothetical protein